MRNPTGPVPRRGRETVGRRSPPPQVGRRRLVDGAEAALRAEALPALEALAAARAEADSWTSVLQHLVDANAALRKRLGDQDDDYDANDDDLGEYSQLDDVSRVPVNVAME